MCLSAPPVRSGVERIACVCSLVSTFVLVPCDMMAPVSWPCPNLESMLNSNAFSPTNPAPSPFSVKPLISEAYLGPSYLKTGWKNKPPPKTKHCKTQNSKATDQTCHFVIINRRKRVEVKQLFEDERRVAGPSEGTAHMRQIGSKQTRIARRESSETVLLPVYNNWVLNKIT